MRSRPPTPRSRKARLVRCWSESLLSTVGFALVYFLVPMSQNDLDQGSLLGRLATLMAALLLVTFVLEMQLRRSLRPDRLPAEQLSLLLGVVELVVVFFALLYYGSAEEFAGLRTRLDSLYFTVTTLCTVGYGDITPVGPTARALATLQMVFDLVIVTSVLSLIVNAGGRLGRRRPEA